MKSPPVFIIGAARSGTNLLRNLVTQFPKWETWDCDEINAIWRYGNRSLAHDEFSPSHATASVSKYITAQFEKLESRYDAKAVVEKTCANSLRIPFILTIFPDARFIHIVRDGRDVVLSAYKRWHADIEPRYLFKKLRHIPVADIPFYASEFLRDRIHQQRSAQHKRNAWGPRFKRMPEWSSDRDLNEVCARQWAECVQKSQETFSTLSEEKVFQIKYEDLVRSPEKHLADIAFWAGEKINTEALARMCAYVHDDHSLGWKKSQQTFTSASLEIMAPMLEANGYELST